MSKKSKTPKRQQITTWLAYYGVHEHIDIDERGVDAVLNALTQPDVRRVWIDKEGNLQIEFDDTDMEGA